MNLVIYDPGENNVAGNINFKVGFVRNYRLYFFNTTIFNQNIIFTNGSPVDDAGVAKQDGFHKIGIIFVELHCNPIGGTLSGSKRPIYSPTFQVFFDGIDAAAYKNALRLEKNPLFCLRHDHKSSCLHF
jgi:hypothetical protein